MVGWFGHGFACRHVKVRVAGMAKMNNNKDMHHKMEQDQAPSAQNSARTRLERNPD
jgi:hypothetical protein